MRLRNERPIGRMAKHTNSSRQRVRMLEVCWSCVIIATMNLIPDRWGETATPMATATEIAATQRKTSIPSVCRPFKGAIASLEDAVDDKKRQNRLESVSSSSTRRNRSDRPDGVSMPRPLKVSSGMTDEGADESHAQKCEEIRKLADRFCAYKKVHKHAAKDRLNILKLREQTEERDFHGCPYL